ncbi:MAG: thioredoxin [Alphaproteobacteria bacterium]
MATTATTDDKFETDVLQSDVPVVVDFWAEWCGPCKSIAPDLEALSDELADKVKIVKVNIEENPMTPGKYAVRGIPTLLLFKDGQIKAQQVGAMGKSDLQAWIEGGLDA